MQLQSVKVNSFAILDDSLRVDTFQNGLLTIHADDIMQARVLFDPADGLPSYTINAYAEQAGELGPANQVAVSEQPVIEVHCSWYSFYAPDTASMGLPIQSINTIIRPAQVFLPAIKPINERVPFRSDWLEAELEVTFEPHQ